MATVMKARNRKETAYTKEYYLKKHYGISQEEFDSMSLAQNHCCKICKWPAGENRALDVDHCHLTGKIRGLLCNKCNRGLGLFKDNPSLLISAASYLEN